MEHSTLSHELAAELAEYIMLIMKLDHPVGEGGSDPGFKLCKSRRPVNKLNHINVN